MIVNAITVFVKPEHIEDFIRATEDNHRESIQEAGNLRFDISQSREDPSRFLLYEAYISVEDAAYHKNTPHYAKWRDAVAPWMAKPREGVSHNILFPKELSGWKK